MTTLSEIGNLTGSSNAIARWATFGPYYAMFPIDFAFRVVHDYSRRGDFIIDPFAGRFSAVYAGAVLGRHSTGIEINPVGWLYGKAKLNPAPKNDVLSRLAEIVEISKGIEPDLGSLSEFFELCFSPPVLRFLYAAQQSLNWRRSKVDWTLMAIILVNLHGKLGEGLSNQMRQTKAMSAPYSVAWWKKRNLTRPPLHDPLAFLTQKIEWRYKKGIAAPEGSHKVILGEATRKLQELVRDADQHEKKYSLLFTSPPYQAVVDYHADQWIRLWLLGAKKSRDRFTRRFNSKADYLWLLDEVFRKCSAIMADRSTVFVRTDVREFTFASTLASLKKHFPEHTVRVRESEVVGISQTHLFNNVSKLKEVDLILTR